MPGHEDAPVARQGWRSTAPAATAGTTHLPARARSSSGSGRSSARSRSGSSAAGRRSDPSSSGCSYGSPAPGHTVGIGTHARLRNPGRRVCAFLARCQPRPGSVTLDVESVLLARCQPCDRCDRSYPRPMSGPPSPASTATFGTAAYALERALEAVGRQGHKRADGAELVVALEALDRVGLHRVRCSRAGRAVSAPVRSRAWRHAEAVAAFTTLATDPDRPQGQRMRALTLMRKADWAHLQTLLTLYATASTDREHDSARRRARRVDAPVRERRSRADRRAATQHRRPPGHARRNAAQVDRVHPANDGRSLTTTACAVPRRPAPSRAVSAAARAASAARDRRVPPAAGPRRRA